LNKLASDCAKLIGAAISYLYTTATSLIRLASCNVIKPLRSA
jgi:hypothetical protein